MQVAWQQSADDLEHGLVGVGAFDRAGANTDKANRLRESALG
jgi:hypothetical protein